MAAQRPKHAHQNGPRQRILRIGILLGGKIVEEYAFAHNPIGCELEQGPASGT